MKFIVVFFISFISLFGAIKILIYTKKSQKKKEIHPLIIGGIHGDEPGGYFAPAFLEKILQDKKR